MLESAFVALFLLLQSQPPSPSPFEPTHNDQTKKSGKQHVETKKDAVIHSPPPAPNPISAAPSHQGQETTPASDKPSDWWMILPTIAIAGAALWQAFIYSRQADYMRRALRISIRQSRIANRNA
jgi:hypothetical protein